MVINKKLNDFMSLTNIENMLSFLMINKDDLEIFFNLEKLKEKKWIFVARDDNNFDIDEIKKIVESTQDLIENFICVKTEPLFINQSLKNLDSYLFENTEKDWCEILSWFNEYTLWNSVIFDINMNIFIIKPWSAGYNLMVAGEPQLITKICKRNNGWLINRKYPICPV